MWRYCGGALAVLALLLPALQAQEETEKKAEPTPAEQINELTNGYTAAMKKFMTEYRKAKTNEARQQLFKESYPKPGDYSSKLLDLVGKYPDDPAAKKAILWILQYGSRTPEAPKVAKQLLERVAKDPKSAQALADLSLLATRTSGPTALEAAQLLVDNFVDNDELKMVCMALSRDKSHQPLLRQVIEKTSNDSVKGHAMFALANSMLGRGAKPNKEAEELLTKVISDFGDIESSRGKKLGELAAGPLYEMQHLQIGMVAPNIEGEDVDGEALQLADYKGKVVVLDFWGDW